MQAAGTRSAAHEKRHALCSFCSQALQYLARPFQSIQVPGYGGAWLLRPGPADKLKIVMNQEGPSNMSTDPVLQEFTCERCCDTRPALLQFLRVLLEGILDRAIPIGELSCWMGDIRFATCCGLTKSLGLAFETVLLHTISLDERRAVNVRARPLPLFPESASLTHLLTTLT